MSDDVTQAKTAVEAILSHRVATEEGFAARLEEDPNGTVGPIIAEVLEDDGDLDFSATTIVVHAAAEDELHFVVPPQDSEVAGFRWEMGFSMDRMVMKPIFGGGPGMVQEHMTSMGGEGDAKCEPTSTHCDNVVKFG